MDHASFISQFQHETFSELPRLIQVHQQVHQAAQLVAALGRSFLPFHKSDSFANLGFDPTSRQFRSRTVLGRFQVMAALEVETLQVHLLSASGQSFAHLDLHGKSFQEGIDFLKNGLAKLGYDADQYGTGLPYTIPSYPEANGKAFDGSDREALSAFALGYQNARLWMDYIAAKHGVWAEIRTWPHHFDLYTRRRMANGQWHMGIGYSPTHAVDYAEPHYHLTYIPKDGVDTRELPEMPGGKTQWHTDRWLGVVLRWSDYIKVERKEDQARLVLDIADQGIDTLAALKNASLAPSN